MINSRQILIPCLALALAYCAATQAGCGAGDGITDTSESDSALTDATAGDIADDDGTPGDVASGDITTDAFHVDLATLDAGQVVLAFGYAGGFITSEKEMFFENRHGPTGLFIFGDGRYIFIRGYTQPFPGYRTYRQANLPEGKLQELVDIAARLTTGEGIRYTVCQALDAGDELIDVNLPDLDLRASAWPNFIHDCGTDGSGPQPGPNLIALAQALGDVDTSAGTELVPERIVLGGFDAVTYPSSCTAENSVDWAWSDVQWQGTSTSWQVDVDAPLAAEIRTFLRSKYAADGFEWGFACIKRYDKVWEVFYDDKPDEDELFPF